MKPIYVIVLVAVSVCLAIVISLYGDTSQYVSFQESKELAVSKPNLKVHVVCVLNKNKPMIYEPSIDPNYFEFYASDSTGIESKVIYKNAKPQDIERTEKIVIIGKYKENHFEASGILNKCPSKYEKKD